MFQRRRDQAKRDRSDFMRGVERLPMRWKIAHRVSFLTFLGIVAVNSLLLFARHPLPGAVFGLSFLCVIAAWAVLQVVRIKARRLASEAALTSDAG